MQVKLQDCGCIALPDEVMAALGLQAGALLDVALGSDDRSVLLTAVGDERSASAFRPTAACGWGSESR